MRYRPDPPIAASLPLLATCALLALAGCEPRELPPLAPPIDAGPINPPPDSDTTPAPTLAPANGSMAGYFEVTLDLSAQSYGPDQIQRVELGGIAGIYLTPGDDTLRFMVQGHPEPGPVDLVIYTARGEHTAPDAFTYDPPRVDGLRHVVALGASISQGFQAGAPTAEGMLGSPPTWVAHQLGAYMGMPLLIDGLFPDFERSDVAPPPLCETPNVTEWVTRSVALLVPKLTAAHPDNLPIAAGGRVDPTLVASHIALAGSTVADTLYGPSGGGSTVLAHLAYEPDETIFDPVDTSPIDQAEMLAPDVLLAIDFYGNDVLLEIPPDTQEEEDALRAFLVADITAAVERMAGIEAQVFVGDIPPTSIMPDWRLLVAVDLREADPADRDRIEAERAAQVEIVDERTRVANEALYAAADRFDNVHLIPTRQAVLDIIEAPLMVGDQALTFEMFGGLVGLDGVHFTDTGSAHTANLVIGALNDALALDVPLVDLEAVLADDPESPEALRALGIPVDDCLR